jgi:hypothetical protein
MKSKIEDFLIDNLDNSSAVIKLGKKSKHYFDTNISKNSFYQVLSLYTINPKDIKYESIISFRYYDYCLDIINKNKNVYYQLLNIQNWKEYKECSLDVIVQSFERKSLQAMDFPSTDYFHHQENKEKMSIRIDNNVKLCFQITNQNYYQIFMEITLDEKLKFPLTNVLETLKTIGDNTKEVNNVISNYTSYQS